MKLLKIMTGELAQFCQTFTQVPPYTPYPYITLEAEQVLQGLPWGPSVVIVVLKIWSRYPGTQEILKMAKKVEEFLNDHLLSAFPISLKILESALVSLKDGQTRVHHFRLKVRIPGDYNE